MRETQREARKKEEGRKIRRNSTECVEMWRNEPLFAIEKERGWNTMPFRDIWTVSRVRPAPTVTRAVSRRASNYAGYRVCTRGIRMGQRACPSISRAARHGTSRRKNLITILGRVGRHRCREIYQRERNREFTRFSSLFFFSLSSHCSKGCPSFLGEDNRGGSTRLSFEPAKSD